MNREKITVEYLYDTDEKVSYKRYIALNGKQILLLGPHVPKNFTFYDLDNKTHQYYNYWRTVLRFVEYNDTKIAIPLFVYETLQNESYLVVRSQSTPITSDKVNELIKLDDIAFISLFNLSVMNNYLVITATKSFGIFLEKYITEGHIPYSSSDVVYVYGSKGNHSIGDTIVLNNTKHHIVGIVSVSPIAVLFGASLKYPTVIKISSKPITKSYVLLINFFVFSGTVKIMKEIKSILGDDISVFPLSVQYYQKNYLWDLISTFTLAFIVISYLFVVSIRNDSAVLFSLGWRPKKLYYRIYFEYILVVLVGYVLSLIFLSLILWQLKLYFFINVFLFLIHLPELILGSLSVLVFSYILIIKLFAEVLFE
ncbi:MAG: hypothetical protein ACP6IS_09840 [Candidatus Asgardarchaeia archaeon]